MYRRQTSSSFAGSPALAGATGERAQQPQRRPPSMPQKGALIGDCLDTTWQEQIVAFGQDLQGLLALVALRQSEFNCLNLATALHRIASIRGGSCDQARCPVLLSRVEQMLDERPDTFRAQSLANMCWALARLQWPCRAVLDKVCAAACRQLPKFKSAELSMVLWGIASSPSATSATRLAAAQAVASEVQRRGAGAFDAQSLATIAYASGIVTMQDSDPLWVALGTGSEDRVKEFSHRQLANLVWAFATVVATDGVKLFGRVEEAVRMNDLAPIDLSLVAWSFAKLDLGGDAFYDDVAAAVLEKEHLLDTSDARNVAVLIYALALAGQARNHDAAFRALAAAVSRRPGDFVVQGLTNAIWGYATASYAESDWFTTVGCELLRRHSSEFEPLDVANCLWAFAAVSHSGAAVVEKLKGLGWSILPEFTAQNLAISLWSFAVLEVRDEAFFERAGDLLVQSKLHECKTQELNNTLWAAATASVRLPWLFIKVSSRALELGLQDFKSHELSIMMWSHGMAGVCNHEFFDAVLEELSVRRGLGSCSPREVANTAWAYSTIIGCSSIPWLAAVALYSCQRISEFDMQCIGNVLWSFATVGVFCTPVFDAACGEMAGRLEASTGTSEGFSSEAMANVAQVLSAAHATRCRICRQLEGWS